MACKNCNLVKCGCADSYLTTPAPCPTPSDCPDVQPCSEVFDSQCVVYTGDDLLCDQDTVVLQNSTVHTALEAIVAYFCANAGQAPAKEIFYQEHIERADLSGLPNSTWSFAPGSYSSLTYTNSTGETKVFKVWGSYDCSIVDNSPNLASVSNYVDMGIIKTVSAVDTAEYIVPQDMGIQVELYDGPTITDITDASTSTKVYSDKTQGSARLITLSSGGTGYPAVGEAVAATGGAGSGLTISYTSTGGIIDGGSLQIIDPGTGYNQGDLVSLPTGGTACSIQLDQIWNDGQPYTFSITNGGTGYPDEGFFAATTGGTGTGLQITFKASGGVIYYAEVASQGSFGYTLDDNITISGAGNGDAVLNIVRMWPLGAVDVRFTVFKLPTNGSIFKLLTLNDGESVSIKFRTKTGANAILEQAQIMVEEV